MLTPILFEEYCERCDEHQPLNHMQDAFFTGIFHLETPVSLQLGQILQLIQVSTAFEECVLIYTFGESGLLFYIPAHQFSFVLSMLL